MEGLGKVYEIHLLPFLKMWRKEALTEGHPVRGGPYYMENDGVTFNAPRNGHMVGR